MFTGPLFQIKLHVYLPSTVLLSKFYSSFRSFEIHWVRQHLVNCMGLAGIVNPIVYKTEPITTGPRHGKLSPWLHIYLLSDTAVPSSNERHRSPRGSSYGVALTALRGVKRATRWGYFTLNGRLTNSSNILKQNVTVDDVRGDDTMRLG